MTTVVSDTADVILVGGAPRSGTTLLSALLSTSDDCQPFLPEFHYLAEVIRAWSTGAGAFETSTRHFTADRSTFDRLHFDFVDRLLDEARKANGQPAKFVLKHCQLTPVLPVLMRKLPRVKAIVIERSCTSLAASMHRAFGDAALSDAGIQRLIRTYNGYYSAAVAAALADPERCRIIQYDILVSGGYDLATWLGISPLRPDKLWTRAEFDLLSLAANDPLKSDLWGEGISTRRVETDDDHELEPALAQRIRRDTQAVADHVRWIAQGRAATLKEFEPC